MRPTSSKITQAKKKEKRKRKERSTRGGRKEEKRKKAIDPLLVFIMATLELGADKK